MKHIINTIIIILIIVTSLVLCVNVDAATTWNVTKSTEQNVYGVNHIQSYGTTTTAGQSEGNQHVNVLSMKTDGINSKMVSWAIQSSNTGYTRSTLTNIAKDYEKNHPGWMVVAGINADQYYQYYGSKLTTDGSYYFIPQTYYPCIMDGETRFAVTATGNSNSNFIGIKNDGSTNSIVLESNVIGMAIDIYNNEETMISTIPFNYFNQKPGTGETTVWVPYNNMGGNSSYDDIELSSNTKNIYIIEKADLCYMNNSSTWDVGAGVNSGFAKGTITSISDSATLSAGQFAIETNDNDLISALSEGIYVKTTYKYASSEMNNCESALGYHSVQRYQNVSYDGQGSYDTRRYNRSIFGKKADGTYVLVTIDKANFAGTTHDESNKILEYYGVTDAWQQDGGGSVTCIIRNSSGEFDVTNKSSDGSGQRSIYNGVFFVVRDPGIALYAKDATRNSLTFTKFETVNDQYISNLQATYYEDGEYKTVNLSDSLTITGLKEDTEYEIKLTYDLTIGGKTVNVSADFKCKTDYFHFPNLTIKTDKINGNSITVYDIKYFKSKCETLSLSLNGQTYSYDKNGTDELDDSIRFGNLTKDTEYILVVKYSILDSETQNIYNNEEQIKINTAYNCIPEVLDFKITEKDNIYSASLLIEDEDSLITDYYIIVDDEYPYWSEDVPNTIPVGSLSEGAHRFKLIIEYTLNKNNYTIEQDLEYMVNTNIEPLPVVPNVVKKGCKKSTNYIISLISISAICAILLRRKR